MQREDVNVAVEYNMKSEMDLYDLNEQSHIDLNSKTKAGAWRHIILLLKKEMSLNEAKCAQMPNLESIPPMQNWKKGFCARVFVMNQG